MAVTKRELRLDITADASQAEAEVKSVQRAVSQIESPGVIGALADVQTADRFNSNARNAVGVLGDFDTALQTIGSTTGNVSLQIVGDFFAVGEAFGQLQGALPLLGARAMEFVGGLSNMTKGLGLASLAVAALALATQQIVASAQELARENTSAFNAQVEASLKALEVENMTAEQRLERAKELQAQIDVLDKQTTDARILRQQQWDAAVEESSKTFGMFGEFLTKVSDAVGKDTRVNEEAILAYEERSTALKAELEIYGDISALEGEVTSAREDEIGAIESTVEALQGGDTTNNDYAESVKYVALNTEIASRKAEEYANRLGGVSRGIALVADNYNQQTGTFFPDAIKNMNEWAKKGTDAQADAMREYERQLAEQERMRQRALEDQKRTLENQLDSIADFERRRFDIEQGYRDATFDATLNNDVLAFLGAGRERERALEQASAGIQVNGLTVNMGEIASPADVANAQNALVQALQAVLAQQAGTF